MEQGQLNWITNFIWGIADDVLRDLYVRGKYRDVILPMIVLRRLDALDAFLPPPAESPIQALAKASRVTSTRKARVGRFAHSPPPGAPVIPAGGMREVIEDQKRERPDKDSHG